MLEITALASGSNGNCYYIGNKEDAVIVDAGISCKQIVARMSNLSLDIGKIKGIFVTHEHSDHIRGIEVFSRKFDVPVYISKKTFTNSGLMLKKHLVNIIDIGKDLNIGSIRITPFSKKHDAVEPCSYALHYKNKKVCVMTDIGSQCTNVVSNIGDCDAVFLESNYDIAMLENGFYPAYLKKRVASDHGHLSNYQAALLVLEHASPKLKWVFLSHLSGNNNTPEIAHKTFLSLIKERKDLKLKVIKTSRDKETDIVRIK